jgi:ubiquinone/menaquinone biosynthesis C-methylase UbiE
MAMAEKMGDQNASSRAGAGDPSLAPDIQTSWDQSAELRHAVQIVDVARRLARSMPAPRGAPYFCLDNEAVYDLSVLDALWSRGIFRKYEFALDIGSGLGGRARWLAARSGCRVVGVDPRPSVVAAALMLNQRARMDDQVSFQVGRFDRLPLRDRVFTHVWMVDPTRETAVPEAFAEAFRVLRNGGYFALQGPARLPADGAMLAEVLRRAGFVDIEVSHAASTDLPHAYRVARERLDVALRAGFPHIAARETEPAPAREPVRTQIFARRFT